MFHALFKARYHELRAALARLMGDASLAAESAHEAYLRLAAVERAGIGDPFAYAVTVAANLATDQGRRQHLERCLLAPGPDPDQHPDGAPWPERVAAARPEVALLRVALAELAPRPRTALLLSRVEGWSHARIAGHLQVSERMVAKYIAGVLQQLRQRLRADEPDGG